MSKKDNEDTDQKQVPQYNLAQIYVDSIQKSVPFKQIIPDIQKEGLHRLFSLFVTRKWTKTENFLLIAHQKDQKTGELNTKSIDFLTNPKGIQQNYGHFCVNLSSIFYLGKIDMKIEGTTQSQLSYSFDSNAKCLLYFVYNARKQLGPHLFTTKGGLILSDQTNVTRLIYENGSKTINYRYRQRATMQSIYPCIRRIYSNRIDKIEKQELVFGLDYTDFKEKWVAKKGEYEMKDTDWGTESVQKGLRAYHCCSTDTKPLYCGGVYELSVKYFTEKYIEKDSKVSKAKYLEKDLKRFAIYVCAGARLTGLDNVCILAKRMDYENYLLEQGGVVIGFGELVIRIPYTIEKEISGKKGREKTIFDFNINDFLQKFVPKYKAKQNPIQNPVIFLGAIESEYNSSCWEFQITRYKPSSDQKKELILSVPEGGSFVAVEEWDVGIEEILCRHTYEQLHRSVVRPMNTQTPYSDGLEWKSPENTILDKILDVSQNRCLEIDIFMNSELDLDSDYKTVRQSVTQLPKEFNFSHFEPKDVKDLKKPEEYKKTFCCAPAYPPVVKDGQLYYLPQKLNFNGKEWDLENVYQKYNLDSHYRTTDPQLFQQNSPPLKLSSDKYEWTEYEWKRMDWLAIKPTIAQNQKDYRLGIDGCYYEKTSEVIGKLNTYYYAFEGSVDLEKARKQVVQTQDGQPKGNQTNQVESSPKAQTQVEKHVNEAVNSEPYKPEKDEKFYCCPALIMPYLHRLFGLFVTRHMSKDGNIMYIIHEEISTKMSALNTDPVPFVKNRRRGVPMKDQLFCVKLSSIFYLGPINMNIEGTTQGKHHYDFDNKQKCLVYFLYNARKQLGPHLFTTKGGIIMSALTSMARFDGKTPEYNFSDMAPVHSIYPCFRRLYKQLKNQNYAIERQELVFGLDYTNFKKPNEGTIHWGTEKKPNGLRTYNRFQSNYKPLYCGGVNELNVQFFLGKYIENNSKAKHLNDERFAIYVCAGARLTGLDNVLEKSDLVSKHQRYLLEEGGVIIGFGKLEINIPYIMELRSTKGSNMVGKYRYHNFQFNDFLQKFVPKYKATQNPIQNPVIFLGAIESEYNSSCWEFNFNHYSRGRTTYSDNKASRLMVPEGGSFVAVEEWDAGIEEILCRHKYEELHLSVVKPMDNSTDYLNELKWKSPENTILEKILDVSQNRCLEIDIFMNSDLDLDSDYKTVRQSVTQLPKEFNFSHFEPKDVKDLKKPEEYKKTFCCAPAYPPVVKDGQLYYLPQKLNFNGKEWDLENVYQKYNLDSHYRTTDPQLFQQNSPPLKLSSDKYEWTEYEWKRMDWLAIKPTIAQNQKDYRLGIDGCYYEKTSEVIGKLNTYYYAFEGSVDLGKARTQVVQTQQLDQSAGTPIAGPSSAGPSGIIPFNARPPGVRPFNARPPGVRPFSTRPPSA